MSFDIEDLCDKLVDLGILDAVGQKAVIWDDLNASTDAEKLAAAKTMAEINSTLIATGEQPFTGEEIRVAAGYEGSPAPLGEDDEEEENETSDSAGKP